MLLLLIAIIGLLAMTGLLIALAMTSTSTPAADAGTDTAAETADATTTPDSIPDPTPAPTVPSTPDVQTTTPQIITVTGGQVYAAPTPTVCVGLDNPNFISKGSELKAGERLLTCGSIVSSDNSHVLVMQSDNNLVIYDGKTKKPTWASNTPGSRGLTMLIMQEDGNAVLYDEKMTPFWASNTQGSGGTRLLMQNNGNLVMYKGDGSTAWATGTVDSPAPAPVESLLWTEVDGADFGGNDLQSLQNMTVASCESACAGNSACQGAMFAPDTKECWLKSKLGTPSLNSNRQLYVPSKHTSTQFHNIPWMDWPNNDVATIPNSSPLDCAASCLENPACRGVSYGVDNKTCWLKSSLKANPNQSINRQTFIRARS